MAFIQNVSAASSVASGVTTFTTPAGSAVGTGHGIAGFFFANVDTGSPVFTITDNASHTYTQPDAALLMTAGQYIGHFYLINISGNPTTLTVTVTGGTLAFPGLNWDEFSTELASGIILDKHLRGPTSAGVAPALANGMTTGNVTTVNDGELIYGWAMGSPTAAQTLTPGTSFTARGANASILAYSESRIQATHGAIAATYTASGTTGGTYGLGIMTFGVSDVLMAQACM